MQKYPEGLISTVQGFTAISAIGPSALRNQGATGVIKATREYLSQMDLKKFQVSSLDRFQCVLDSETAALVRSFPKSARNWGAARKALNLFLRDSLYNRYLSECFHLSELESWLEIPLDSIIAGALKKKSTRGELPPWKGLKNLKPENSLKFQDFASIQAKSIGIARVHLDMYLWIEGR
jgi:hypothetical protein